MYCFTVFLDTELLRFLGAKTITFLFILFVIVHEYLA
jgi:hypothetical protein